MGYPLGSSPTRRVVGLFSGAALLAQLPVSSVAWSPKSSRPDLKWGGGPDVTSEFQDEAFSESVPWYAARAMEEDLVDFRQHLEDDAAEYAKRHRALGPELRPAGKAVGRLKASETGSGFSRNLTCARPVAELSTLSREHSFDAALLGLPLRDGRACAHELCSSERCGFHVREGHPE